MRAATIGLAGCRRGRLREMVQRTPCRAAAARQAGAVVSRVLLAGRWADRVRLLLGALVCGAHGRLHGARCWGEGEGEGEG